MYAIHHEKTLCYLQSWLSTEYPSKLGIGQAAAQGKNYMNAMVFRYLTLDLANARNL